MINNFLDVIIRKLANIRFLNYTIKQDKYLMETLDVEAIYKRYLNYQVEPVGYATVRDYCDSMDNLRPLTAINFDLKDPQRPWMLKAIIGTVQRGGKLLEIGAGEPYVASILSKLGYDVLVIDPYDGSGNGPQEFEAIKDHYPEISFIRNNFSDNLNDFEPSSFDCIYSISVLEHIPTLQLNHVFAGIEHFIKPGGYGFHAIDYVLKGNGDEFHFTHLRSMVEKMRITTLEFDNILKKLAEDVETYYLSAYGHNLWRGNVPYDGFPMRKCVSIHTCTKY